MKKNFFILAFILATSVLIVIIAIKSFEKTDNGVLIEIEPTITPIGFGDPTDEQQDIISEESNDYRINWVIAREKNNLFLYSNTINKFTSNEAISKNECKYLINSGFIGNNNNHLGLFKNHEGVISNSENNSTLNGYFYIDDKRNAYISSVPPINPKLALQSGPILMKSNSPTNLSLKNDEHARRVIAAVNRKREAIFIVFYRKGNPFWGPMLSELPKLIEKLETNTSLNITDAINLDGGKHSVFITDQLKLSEASIIGGYFCIKRYFR
jgi:uncharacterized protein YigE (DUF2233 family)